MDALLAGLGLGLGSGVAPGPLLALVIAATLRGGFPAGLGVAVAPLLTDLPIIVLSVSVLSTLPPTVLGAAAVVGGLVVAWFGVESMRAAAGVDTAPAADPSTSLSPGRALRQGAIANLTNPSPWLFWLSAGGALLVTSARSSTGSAAAFLVGFYVMLVGSKALVAWGVAAGRHRLTARRYRVVLAASGALLVGLGLALTATAAIGLGADVSPTS